MTHDPTPREIEIVRFSLVTHCSSLLEFSKGLPSDPLVVRFRNFLESTIEGLLVAEPKARVAIRDVTKKAIETIETGIMSIAEIEAVERGEDLP
jgi:hypothetical protein